MIYGMDPGVLSRAEQLKIDANLAMSSLRDQFATNQNPDNLATMVFAEVERNPDGIQSYYLGIVSLNAIWVCVNEKLRIPTLEPVTELKRPPCKLIFKERIQQIAINVSNAVQLDPIIGKEKLYDHIFAKESGLGPSGGSALMAEMELIIASSDIEVV